jgi:hypothetical protein
MTPNSTCPRPEKGTFSVEGKVPREGGWGRIKSLQGPCSHPFWCKRSCHEIRPTITQHYGFIHLPSNGGAVLECQPGDSCFWSLDHKCFQKSSHKSSPIGESHLLWNQYLRLTSERLVAQLGENPRCFFCSPVFPMLRLLSQIGSRGLTVKIFSLFRAT